MADSGSSGRGFGRHGFFQRRDEHARDIEARLFRDLDEAGGTGDVDFGDVIADDVQADQQQAARGELGRFDSL
jgi:hypothetical protein